VRVRVVRAFPLSAAVDASTRFVFEVHGERLAVARLPRDAPVPGWARGELVVVARTPRELSVVCPQARVPGDAVQERDRVALGIVGSIPMETVGILASLCAVLAAARVPVFAVSTFDTDWLMVPADRFDAARAALRAAGHEVRGEAPVA
jgi:hypothetical protein